jgi:ribosomal protein S27AE
MNNCTHLITKDHKCVDCGEVIFAVESRQCGSCHNFKLNQGANVIGGCLPKLMTVISTMHVTYKIKDGTCFVPKKQSSQAKS